MYTFKCLIIAVFIAVTKAKGGDLQGAISDDLPRKPADLLSSISPEITKSDVEITLSGLRVPEDVAADATEANDDSRHDKTPENLTQLQSEQKSASISSAEDAQKITHTSDDNASFIHVKEKIARQSSDEEYADADEQQRDGNTHEHSETKQASDDLKNAEKSHMVPAEIADSKSADKKKVEVAEIVEKSDSVEKDDTKYLLKSDAADDVDIDSTTQSRRMLSFDHKVFDAINIPNVVSEPLLEVSRSGQNNYEHTSSEADYHDHGHYDHHRHSDNDNRHGNPPKTNPLAYSPLNAPTLPPLSLFHSPGQPLHHHFHPPDNIEKHSPLLDKSLLSPDFVKHLHEHPHFDETQNHQNQHFKAVHHNNMFSNPYEQMQPLQSLRQFHLPQNLQHEPPLQPSHRLPIFQTLQPSHSLRMSESWQPLQPLQSIHAPQPSYQASSSSSRSLSSFQPSQLKMDNILSRLQEASQPQHHVQSEVSNQFSDLLKKNWNFVGYNSYSGG